MKVILIAGGSGSGKSTISNSIANSIDSENVAFISMDSYYLPLSHLTLEERKIFNFDHPKAVDIIKLISDIKDLENGKSIDVPVYNFENHDRDKMTIKIKPTKVLIVDGILALHFKELRDLADIKLYIQTEGDIRFIRRLSRDISERGRQMDDVITQYLLTVKPMHQTFVKPSIQHADIIIPFYEFNSTGADLIASKIKQIIKK
ncbi:uridine kinase [Spiroplasma sp. TIUS-1]|uniref:uridine kinase n=1 Tax=Spiroplasma sp. TIUS-1 TaxID=216963 RepID=UPI001398EB11|nr:uridine kinase [Spiroplasma sp. TIUS-1]QHX35895.1 uridine kinase [Spiroplasma sp. TIUS-1]